MTNKHIYDLTAQLGTAWESIHKLDERLTKLENPVDIPVYRTKPSAKLPIRATSGSSGYDVYATERIPVHAHGSLLIPTGLKMRIPEGYEIQIRPKSGLALHFRLTVLNSPGTIDSDYRGELGVIVINHGDNDYVFNAHDKVAQIVCCKVSEMNFVEVDEDEFSRQDTENQRGAGGFGSTGRS